MAGALVEKSRRERAACSALGSIEEEEQLQKSRHPAQGDLPFAAAKGKTAVVSG